VTTACSHCQAIARCVGYRDKTMVSLLGPLRLERHYYHCAACGQGFCPWDAELGIGATALSPAAAEVACVAGVQASFAEASEKVLPKLAGLRLAESTVERSTEAAGERLAAAQASGQGEAPVQEWAWHRDREGKTVAYVAVDATGVAQQGPRGAQAEGRMANVAMIYNPVPEDPAQWAEASGGRAPTWQARYLASLAPMAEVGPLLRQQGGMVGIERAERWIALADGGSGLEGMLRTQFPRVEAVILDFYHAAEYLSELAKSWGGADPPAAEALGQQWCHQLKHQGGQAVLATLQGLDVRGRSAAARECYQATVRYVANQVHRMDYPQYRAKGWQIGSGPVESACKRVVGQRLKGAGMRWGEEGAEAVCRLRALFLSEAGPWDAFWSHN
jgi:hypothetical protein